MYSWQKSKTFKSVSIFHLLVKVEFQNGKEILTIQLFIEDKFFMQIL